MANIAVEAKPDLSALDTGGQDRGYLRQVLDKVSEFRREYLPTDAERQADCEAEYVGRRFGDKSPGGGWGQTIGRCMDGFPIPGPK